MSKKTFTPGRIDVISMGCSKNLVDSERLLHRLGEKGYHVVHDSDTPCGEYVVVNTCGFIADAKEESIDILLQLAELKAQGLLRHIYVMGCLSERYRNELPTEMPEIDRWYGKFDWTGIIDTLPDYKEAQSPVSATTENVNNAAKGEATEVAKREVKEWERTLTTPPWSAYLKISEGCNRFCAFCAIPLITGRHKSRPIEEIADEVRRLVAEGVKEFNVIAQDLSSYGIDLYGEQRLAQLIETISDIPGVEWIRMHYAYPADFPKDILRVMRERDNVCKYLDIALQHISDPVLTNMQRHITGAETISLLKEIRDEVPDIKIRTTLMTGFPGEGDEQFEQLLDFVRAMRFERMGAFAYCEEDDTRAARTLEDNIPEDIKQRRLDLLMETQENIALERNREMIGRRIKVLIERRDSGDAIGRSQWDSPEVDPEVIVVNCDAQPGEFTDVIVTDALTYELLATQADANE